MGTPIASHVREKLLQALSEWRVGEGVLFTLTAQENMRKHLEKITQSRLVEMIQVWIQRGCDVFRVEETRPEWASLHDCYYKILMPVGGKKVFIEMRLLECQRLQPPKLLIANVHP